MRGPSGGGLATRSQEAVYAYVFDRFSPTSPPPTSATTASETKGRRRSPKHIQARPAARIAYLEARLGRCRARTSNPMFAVPRQGWVRLPLASAINETTDAKTRLVTEYGDRKSTHLGASFFVGNSLTRR